MKSNDSLFDESNLDVSGGFVEAFVNQVKIISITNAHAWDGTVMTRNTFHALIHALQFSGFTHTVKYVLENKTIVIHI